MSVSVFHDLCIATLRTPQPTGLPVLGMQPQLTPYRWLALPLTRLAALQLIDGSTIELSRRERPELVHESGQPVALISGAQFGALPGNPGDQTFTLVQQVLA